MGGGMGGGGMPGQQPPPVIPRNADVWEVLEAILGNKPLPKHEQPEQQNAPEGMPGEGQAPGAMGASPLMGSTGPINGPQNLAM